MDCACVRKLLYAAPLRRSPARREAEKPIAFNSLPPCGGGSGWGNPAQCRASRSKPGRNQHRQSVSRSHRARSRRRVATAFRNAMRRSTATASALYREKFWELSIPQERWADLTVRGILTINSFRQRPLRMRTEPTFPDPVARSIKRHPICGLSGLQVLGIYLAIESKGDASAVISTLFKTDGVLPLYSDWTEFLRYREG